MWASTYEVGVGSGGQRSIQLSYGDENRQYFTTLLRQNSKEVKDITACISWSLRFYWNFARKNSVYVWYNIYGP